MSTLLIVGKTRRPQLLLYFASQSNAVCYLQKYSSGIIYSCTQPKQLQQYIKSRQKPAYMVLFCFFDVRLQVNGLEWSILAQSPVFLQLRRCKQRLELQRTDGESTPWTFEQP